MASASSNPCQWEYDVFISFSGADIRHGFLSHLFEALRRNQIIAFKDENLERGEMIEPALLQRIEESRVSIVIFTENYAYSSWCLDELMKIMDCKKLKGQIVLPVFYRVDPTDVQELTGSYGDAFAKHAEEFQDKLESYGGDALVKHMEDFTNKVENWKLAVKETAVMSGFVSQDLKSEYELIEELVKHILKGRDESFFDPFDDLVGIKSRLEDMEQLLDLKETNVCCIGIWGMAGIGKTTLAKRVYDRSLSQFQGRCFIENVREELEHCTKVELREKIMSMLGKENLSIGMPIMSSSSVRKWIMRKKVLIVLDDVWDLDVAEFLIGKQDIYAPGSRIIITSRDKQILKNVCDKIYQVKELNNSDALQLFSLRAFKLNSPTEAFMQAAKMVAKYAGGNPLALRVLGSNLYDKDLVVWEDQLKKLKNIPEKKIEKILRISYDALDENEKEIFLDIACFFKSEDKRQVENLLESCLDRYAKIGISCLVDKCLINISNNKLGMHDLLQQMGKEIVRNECVKNPGKRSRLWNPQDICHVFKKNTGTSSVESMSLDTTKMVGLVELSPTTFIKMSNLKFLYFYYSYPSDSRIVQFSIEDVENYISQKDSSIHGYIHLSEAGLDYLPNELRYLYWFGYPLKSLPLKFCPENLVQLHLIQSHVQQLSNEDQCLKNLKVLNLSYSINLIKIPDLSGLPKLKILRLKGCRNLVEINSSFRYHNKLSLLDLGDCENLCSFPRSFEFTALSFLSIEGCSKLREFPKVPHNISHLNFSRTTILKVPPLIGRHSFLTQLWFGSCTGLESLPSCIGELKSLETLSLDGCSKLKSLPDELCNLKALKYFDIAECQNLNGLPENLGNLESLLEIWAGRSGLKKLPRSINLLRRLERLDCNSCKDLTLPPLTGLANLKKLYLRDCGVTEISICKGSLVLLKELWLSGNIFEKPPMSIGSLVSLEELHLRGNLLEMLLTGIRYLCLNACKRLKCLPEYLPSSLQHALVANCTSLESMLKWNEDNGAKQIDASNCTNLDVNISRNIMDEFLETMEHSLPRYHLEHFLEQVEPRLCIPGDEVLQGMKYQNNNGSFLQCPLKLDPREFVVLALCAVIEPNQYACGDRTYLDCECNLESDGGQFFHGHSLCCWESGFEINWSTEHVLLWQSTIFMISGIWNKASFKFEVKGVGGLSPAPVVIKCGVHPIYHDKNPINRYPDDNINRYESTEEEAREKCYFCRSTLYLQLYAQARGGDIQPLLATGQALGMWLPHYASPIYLSKLWGK